MNRVVDWSGHGWVAMLTRWYLGAVFVLASLHKIAHPGEFALDIATYDILPLSLINLMAVVLPWVEMIAGSMLIAGIRARATALVVTGMMFMFLISLIIALWRGMDMACGCFAGQGQEQDPISWLTVLRDVAWLALALYVLLLDRRPLGVEQLWHKWRRSHA